MIVDMKGELFDKIEEFDKVIMVQAPSYISDWLRFGAVDINVDYNALEQLIEVKLFKENAQGISTERVKWTCSEDKFKDISLEAMSKTASLILAKFKIYLESHYPVEQRPLSDEISDHFTSIGLEAINALDGKVEEVRQVTKSDGSVEKVTCKRPSKDQYYISIARVVSERSTCLRRRYGAVIVKDDRIISTGYNGAARGIRNCCDMGICKREELGVKPGERYELCVAVHAEQNAIINAGSERCKGAKLYLSGFNGDGSFIKDMDCCMMCKRAILNAGIDEVIFDDDGGNIRMIIPKDGWKNC